MFSKALRLTWKIVVAGFALWGFTLTLFAFAYWANLLPASTNRVIRAGLSMSRAEWRRQQRPPTPRQNSRTPQQLPPVDSDAEADSDADAPDSSPATERGHRRPPHDRTGSE